MNKSEILGKIKSEVLLPVIRADSAESALDISEAVIAGGINNIEITLTVPDAVNVMKILAGKYSESAQIGAGTVLDVKTADECIRSGAEFIVTPCFIPEVVEFCNSEEIPVFSGAFSPTEVYHASKAGADVVKIFPASVGGSSYLKALKGPFPSIEMMPTGGVSLETAESFLNAGAFALGVGGELTKMSGENDSLETIETRAREFVNLIKSL